MQTLFSYRYHPKPYFSSYKISYRISHIMLYTQSYKQLFIDLSIDTVMDVNYSLDALGFCNASCQVIDAI